MNIFLVCWMTRESVRNILVIEYVPGRGGFLWWSRSPWDASTVVETLPSCHNVLRSSPCRPLAWPTSRVWRALCKARIHGTDVGGGPWWQLQLAPLVIVNWDAIHSRSFGSRTRILMSLHSGRLGAPSREERKGWFAGPRDQMTFYMKKIIAVAPIWPRGPESMRLPPRRRSDSDKYIWNSTEILLLLYLHLYSMRYAHPRMCENSAHIRSQ